MSSDLFMKIHGIDGNITVAGHHKLLAISSYTAGARLPMTSIETNQKRTAGHVVIHTVSVTRPTDKCTPPLFTALCTAKPYPLVSLIKTRTVKDTQAIEYQIDLTNAIFDSYATEVTTGNDIFETWTISFTAFDMTYVHQQQQGGESGNAASGWDMQSQTAHTPAKVAAPVKS